MTNFNMVGSNILSIQSMIPTDNALIGKDKTFVGIDFGTSTTVVSIACLDKNGIINVTPIRLEQLLEDGSHFESEKLPSVIAWYHDILLVGEGASNLKYKLTKGKNIWYSFKMEIGEDLGAKYYNSEVGDIEDIRIRNPKDCVRIFFMYIKMLIARYCDKHAIAPNIQYAVSIPASFEANQRKELMEALETNGMTLTKQSLIDEPNAAFISYIQESQKSSQPLLISPHINSNVLVFDFGGGTCDISILEIGKSANGLYSKNIAISKFTKLGGDDVDRYITFHYLMPRLFDENGKTAKDFRTTERQYIATQLYKVAERLKILICKKVALKLYKFEIPSFVKSNIEKETVDIEIEIETTKGYLRQKHFYLTTAEMTEVMKVFLKSSRLPLQIKGEEDYNNIFMPINSALSKANVNASQIDYVLLIGGSAQNPFIQEAIKDYFSDSQILVPQDLQTHVSQGAAIHSLLMNGMNKCIIQPITSEPIFVITKDTNRKVLLPAGSVIPSDTIIIDDLQTTRERQDAIELPICVGSESKLLFNLKITRDGGFPLAAQVKLTIEVNADKLLIARAECLGLSCMVEPQNPFANKELTTEERIVLVAERQANLEAEMNGGKPTKNGLRKLREAYENAGNDFRAAETYELQLELYPDSSAYNSVGVLYHNSGNYDKAIDFFERAIQNNPNNYNINFNLGNSMSCYGKRTDGEKYIKKAYELNPDYYPAIVEMARIEEEMGKKQDAHEKYLRAYDLLMKKWRTGTLDNAGYSWLSSVATTLGHYDIAREVKRSMPKLESEKYYNEENLTRTKTYAIDKK